jgi:YbbR domain-containing protein
VQFDWQKNSIKLLSAFLAFILWVYVSNEQNPVREKVLSVRIEHNQPAQDFIIVGDLPESVSVRVQGNKNQLVNLSPADFRASVAIPEGKTGDFSLPVQVTAPPGLRVAGVVPDVAAISMDRIVEKQIPVAVSLRGVPAEGRTALAPFLEPDTVLVRGPGRVLNSLERATAQVDIQSAATNVEQTVSVSVGPFNATLFPAEVKVLVPVVTSVSSRTIPIRPVINGTPAAGCTVKSSVVEPASAQVLGTPEVLNGISSLRTEAVDIQGLEARLVREVSVIVPEGLSSVQPGRVKVTVEIVKTAPPPPVAPSPDTQPR